MPTSRPGMPGPARPRWNAVLRHINNLLEFLNEAVTGLAHENIDSPFQEGVELLDVEGKGACGL